MDGKTSFTKYKHQTQSEGCKWSERIDWIPLEMSFEHVIRSNEKSRKKKLYKLFHVEPKKICHLKVNFESFALSNEWKRTLKLNRQMFFSEEFLKCMSFYYTLTTCWREFIHLEILEFFVIYEKMKNFEAKKNHF